MFRVVPGVLGAALFLGAASVHAQDAAPQAPTQKPAKVMPKPAPAKPAKSAKPADTKQSASDAVKPSASAPDPAPTPKEEKTAKPSEAASASDAPGDVAAPAAPAPPAAPPEPPTVRVYMRAGTDPLVFSARARNSDGTPTLCAAPCDAKFLPGDYQLRLNGVAVDGAVKFARPGTLQGKFISREGGREGAWLGLNVGGILGGVFITIAALGGPSWTYIAGGGSLLSGGVIFVLTYRADSATVSFSPNEPADVLGLPPPAPAQDNSSGPTHGAGLDRPRFGTESRGLGFRITF
jgi:hypothetical protein